MRGKIIYAVLGLLVFTSFVQAQWRIGGLLGVNVASTAIDPEPQARDYTSRVGFNIGAVVEFPLTDAIDMHAELSFLGKGNTIEDEDFADDLIWKTSYVEIPVMARYTIDAGGTVNPYIAAGPSFGFLSSATFEMEGSPDQDDEEAKSFDFSIAIGGGASMTRDNMTFFAELRYMHGLVNVVDSGTDFEVKNRGIQVLAGVTFLINK